MMHYEIRSRPSLSVFRHERKKSASLAYCDSSCKPFRIESLCKNFTGSSHFRKDCPELIRNPNVLSLMLQSDKPINPARDKRRQLRRLKRREFTGNIWFKVPGQYNPEILHKLKPIGTPLLPMVALDTEGNGLPGNGIGNIHLSGWFGNEIRVQTIYYAEVKTENPCYTNTKITGLQPNDLKVGIPFYQVRQTILEILRNKRVITQGNSDFKSLRIMEEEMIDHNIIWINLQELWGGQPLGLENLERFFFPDKPKLRRENQVNTIIGHSPERDSRVTLLGYLEYLKLKEYNSVPSADAIRAMLKAGRNIKDW